MIKTEYKPIEFLKTHDRNPRKIGDADFEILKESIRSNPDYFEVRPILARSDGTVFAGNMRLRASLALGLKEVPVAVMDVSLEKEREYMIRDNIQNGIWDLDILGADFEVSELAKWGYDADSMGVPSFAPVTADTKLDEAQRWVFVCPECGVEHIFSKKDLKPYEENR